MAVRGKASTGSSTMGPASSAERRCVLLCVGLYVYTNVCGCVKRWTESVRARVRVCAPVTLSCGHQLVCLCGPARIVGVTRAHEDMCLLDLPFPLRIEPPVVSYRCVRIRNRALFYAIARSHMHTLVTRPNKHRETMTSCSPRPLLHMGPSLRGSRGSMVVHMGWSRTRIWGTSR